MSRNNTRDEEINNSFYIPANFTDSGRIIQGMFEVRNLVEAVAFGGGIGYLVWSVFPLDLKVRLILVCMVALPVGVFALIGYHGDCMTRVIRNVILFLKNRRKMRFRRIKVNAQKDSDALPGVGQPRSRTRSR